MPLPLQLLRRSIAHIRVTSSPFDLWRKPVPSKLQILYQATCVHARFQSTESCYTRSGLQCTIPNVLHTSSVRDIHASPSDESQTIATELRNLPTLCPGCGALTQAVNSQEAGFYSKSRRAVKQYLQQDSPSPSTQQESALSHDDNDVKGLPHSGSVAVERQGLAINHDLNHRETPICDRCHDLVYNNKGTSIAHPSVEDLADSIAESPFRRNHVYHVLDAADFPLSLIPKIFSTFELAKPRSQNRRARTTFSSKPSVSFIVTRSDLLGPSKEMVDKMMPYVQDVLRSALGRQGRTIRLGNIHLVSAKRGWWTKELKDAIWNRGGGNWMVGKANVGKSNLFPVLFPKGSDERAPVYAELQADSGAEHDAQRQQSEDNTYLRQSSLLPPLQPETRFPAMPVVSHLPGTTASPIRLSFGNHKGELIDLPGLDRGSLEHHVDPDHKLDLVMEHRPNVKQYIIKPGQSLLLGGGLIRITPYLDVHDPSMTMLAYPFIPVDTHVTATDKAAAIQAQERESGVRSILAAGAASNIRSSGHYNLTTDVTKARAGAILRAGVPLSKIPFKVYSTDILIEGVGWVELVCQVNKRRKFSGTESVTGTDHPINKDNEDETQADSVRMSDMLQSEFEFKPFVQQNPPEITSDDTGPVDMLATPKVEIFSPDGRHIGQRKSLGAWMLWDAGLEQRQDASQTMRPRRPMKGAKRREKIRRRA